MKWIALKVVLVVALVGVALGVALAFFSDEQSSTGAVGMATAGIDLYICEPDGTPGPGCGSDDDADTGDMANEKVFETDEQLLPGHGAEWDIRLKNVGSQPWDTAGLVITRTETADPGADCNTNLEVEVRILGRGGDEINDNHPYGGTCYASLGRFNPVSSGGCYIVHVEPGDYEDMRLYATVPASAGNECSENAWSIDYEWTVVNE